MAICELQGITKTYETGEQVTPIKQADIAIDAGDYIAVTGESGIGKTTLLMLAGGLLKPDEGQLIIDGQDYWSLSDAEQTKLRAEKIGYLFQTIQMVQALTIEENLRLAMKLSGRTPDTLKIRELLTRLGLAEKRDSLPMHLSGGQKRRAMIAVTLIRDPDIIFADEPTNDLDEEWEDKVMSILRECAQKGKAVVLVTHNRKLAEQADREFEICDKTLVERPAVL